MTERFPLQDDHWMLAILTIVKPFRHVFYRILTWKLRDSREALPVATAAVIMLVLLDANLLAPYLLVSHLTGRSTGWLSSVAGNWSRRRLCFSGGHNLGVRSLNSAPVGRRWSIRSVGEGIPTQLGRSIASADDSILELHRPVGCVSNRCCHISPWQEILKVRRPQNETRKLEVRSARTRETCAQPDSNS